MKSRLVFGPVVITDPAVKCPVTVAAGRVLPVRTDRPPIFVSGWGASEAAASANCELEADETFFAQLAPPGRVRRARVAELQGHVLEPPLLVHFSGQQYRNRRRINSQLDERHRIPAPWHSSRRLDWIESDARFSSRQCWVPAGLCLLGHDKDRTYLPAADSTGLAVGSTLEDAVVRGFLEVVERDATAIWWYNELDLPRIALTGPGNDVVASYSAWSRTQGRVLRLLYLTLDIPVPVVAAISSDANGRNPALGFAAGRSTSQAAQRAVGELAQCEANLALLKIHLVRAGWEGFTPQARKLYEWHLETEIIQHPFLAGSTRSTDPSQEELQLDGPACLRMCRDHGMEMVAVDLTHRDGPPLARVFVPGLRQTMPRLGEGRLHDVPVKMGFRRSGEGTTYRSTFPL